MKFFIESINSLWEYLENQVISDVDLSTLLRPFDGDFRGGKDLRENDDPRNQYRRLRDLRQAARDEEKKADLQVATGDESSNSAGSVWRELWEQGMSYLESTAKDLEIVAYMIEASIRIEGFVGLTRSLQLTREMIEAFWGELLPTPDEDGAETTIRPLARLDGDVITYAISRVSITDPDRVGHCTLWQYQYAKRLESLPSEERERSVSRGAISLAEFRSRIGETKVEYLRTLKESIARSIEEVGKLRLTLESKVGEEKAPGMRKFEEGLRAVDAALEELAGDRLKAVAVTSDSQNASNTAMGGQAGALNPGAGVAQTSGEIGSRLAALDLLERVAQWFERHEPQSIIPSEIRKSIRRAKMTPMELYAELISNSDVRREVYRDVGIIVPD